MRRVLRWLLALVPILLIAALIVIFGILPYGVARSIAHTLTHPARAPITRTPTDVGITEWTTVRLDAPDGIQLVGWFIPPPLTTANGTPSDGTALLYLHGFGGNRQSMLFQAAVLYRQGYGALLIDQRAHGESGGELSTLGYLEMGDASIMIDFLLNEPSVNPKKIGILGESMGAVVALLSASHRANDVRAVIAQSPYASVEGAIDQATRRNAGIVALTLVPLARMAIQTEIGVDPAAINPLEQIYWISPRGLLLMHGDLDPVVAPINSQQLYDAARTPRELVFFANGGHGGLIEDDPALWARRVTAFLARYLRDDPIEDGA
ncbi:MAG: alpha/beta fold hydrolase [Chloroflexota bacterium]|nr:alpha/beta fold hydrolase [Chloroflexota bacterium]